MRLNTCIHNLAQAHNFLSPNLLYKSESTSFGCFLSSLLVVVPGMSPGDVPFTDKEILSYVHHEPEALSF